MHSDFERVNATPKEIPKPMVIGKDWPKQMEKPKLTVIGTLTVIDSDLHLHWGIGLD